VSHEGRPLSDAPPHDRSDVRPIGYGVSGQNSFAPDTPDTKAARTTTPEHSDKIRKVPGRAGQLHPPTTPGPRTTRAAHPAAPHTPSRRGRPAATQGGPPAHPRLGAGARPHGPDPPRRAAAEAKTPHHKARCAHSPPSRAQPARQRGGHPGEPPHSPGFPPAPPNPHPPNPRGAPRPGTTAAPLRRWPPRNIRHADRNHSPRHPRTPGKEQQPARLKFPISPMIMSRSGMPTASQPASNMPWPAPPSPARSASARIRHGTSAETRAIAPLPDPLPGR
jgi:hypothetical protein